MQKKLIYLILAVITIVIAYSLIRQITSALKSNENLQQVVDDLHKMEIQNEELKKRLGQIELPQFIEKEARNKLGLVKEGEVLVIIPNEKIEDILGKDKIKQEIKFPNPLGWLKVFFK